MSGSTAPSMMAVRTDCSASSGRTISAGGGCRPIRCRAASTSAITARRSSSDLRSERSVLVQRLEAVLAVGDAGLDVAQPGSGVDQRLVQLAAVEADGVDLVAEPGRGLGGLFLLRADRFELLVALADGVDGWIGLAAGEATISASAPRHRGCPHNELVRRITIPIAFWVTRAPPGTQPDGSLAPRHNSIRTAQVRYARW